VRVFEIGSEFFRAFCQIKYRAGFGLIARAARPVHAGGFSMHADVFSMMEDDCEALRDVNCLAAPIALKKN
jgi:hypothetical protein